SLDGSGIQDPRAYLFYETNNSNQWVAFPQCPDVNTPPSGGMPYQLHRDVNYTIKGNDCIYSPFNYYLIRDENDIPEIILTAAEYYFIKAEAYFYGIGVTADENLAAGACFEGVIASLTFWNTMKENSAIWLFTAPGYETLNPYDLANQIFFTEDKATEISKQRWLDLFRQPWEAYALCRRTENTPREGEALTFLRLPYPPSESEYNSEQWALQTATMGGDLTTINVWWDQ
ncbi:MAG: SusD/RagB family nutrient-binding outer membrane lipoprotein, partial [Bacteroidales bacterium]|nr:SusD/RagB family nutrient-binding outer membrane lipoprotein [Bacteroidales bacterium]MDD2324293.1 SusD/RagB family nutrient-binding outer membrane lipoprotein [Bacteroidales bacterium]MDD3961323.1 SusD/RagB family nutrient-binding outer membrane lipoprotein [Bacteroidales bacterium]